MSLQDFLALADAAVPFLALALLLIAVVLAINALGRRLERHDAWLERLDVRVGNLHKQRDIEWRKSLQIGPPSLSQAKTTEVSEEMLLTLNQKVKKGDEP